MVDEQVDEDFGSEILDGADLAEQRAFAQLDGFGSDSDLKTARLPIRTALAL